MKKLFLIHLFYSVLLGNVRKTKGSRGKEMERWREMGSEAITIFLEALRRGMKERFNLFHENDSLLYPLKTHKELWLHPLYRNGILHYMG